MNFDSILFDKQFVISSTLIKESLKQNLTLNDFLLLIYFINSEDKMFDLGRIKKYLDLSDKDILDSFNNLTTNGLITIDVAKDETGHMSEKVLLSGLSQRLNIDVKDQMQEKKKENIFETFEKEFCRELTPMEYEIINAWLDKGNTQELILGALKESIYNGVKSLRYIDKILYDWSKKGFKTMNDVQNHMINKPKDNIKVELFDYDWLDDND